ncbi:hypothetical protein FHS51_004182 [Sphingobium wenxiniae]|uniref:Uncharacterized protein n=1 Tax=Sphingobium wenxiniae (strain DSM 21828 / CGMCC 1.7748 / JZ-1) TaxID=595605 RepID=A0A562JW27_SPHWJ|nr:hypothetical protein [Sphingobium wenxiniae]MBB6193923.1 hypothetical protein [Sphingobium wenxiniae]TWH87175.1 hypothetical protein IQ35_04007 [Sphingobium wenxiniae]
MRKKIRAHPAAVTVTHDDLEQMKRSSLGLTPIGVKRAAKARASARELFLECGSAEIALAALVSGLPKSMVDRFCRSHLGR